MSPSFPRTVQHTNHRTMLLLVCAYIYTSLARITWAYPEFNPFVFGRCTCRPQYNPILKMTVVINDSIEKETPQPSKDKYIVITTLFASLKRKFLCGYMYIPSTLPQYIHTTAYSTKFLIGLGPTWDSSSRARASLLIY